MENATLDLDLLQVPEPSVIREWATERGILILAHSYQDGFLQEAAHFVGDSLELARKAAAADAKSICFCGVHFMAETAKLLCPDAKVFVPDLGAGCSLADSCKAEDLKQYQQHLTEKLGQRPTTVAYVNCSAAVKALCDIICTSGNAREVVESIPADQPILFVPDKHLGGWLNETLGTRDKSGSMLGKNSSRQSPMLVPVPTRSPGCKTKCGRIPHAMLAIWPDTLGLSWVSLITAKAKGTSSSTADWKVKIGLVKTWPSTSTDST